MVFKARCGPAGRDNRNGFSVGPWWRSGFSWHDRCAGKGDYTAAADEMIASAWEKETPSPVTELTAIMRAAGWNHYFVPYPGDILSLMVLNDYVQQALRILVEEQTQPTLNHRRVHFGMLKG
jgi:hypothetical protein